MHEQGSANRLPTLSDIVRDVSGRVSEHPEFAGAMADIRNMPRPVDREKVADIHETMEALSDGIARETLLPSAAWRAVFSQALFKTSERLSEQSPEEAFPQEQPNNVISLSRAA